MKVIIGIIDRFTTFTSVRNRRTSLSYCIIYGRFIEVQLCVTIYRFQLFYLFLVC